MVFKGASMGKTFNFTRLPFAGAFSGRFPALLLSVWLVMALWAPVLADEESSEPAVLTEEQVQLNLESFDYVWTTIRDMHYDENLGGLDWPAIRDELRPGVAGATSMEAARGVMNDLISRLDQSHFGIFPGDVYEDAAAANDGAPIEGAEDEELEGEGWTGLDLRVRNDQAVVVSVWPGSPGDEAGVRPGWVVLQADGTDLGERIAVLKEKLPEKSSRGYMLASAMSARLTGDLGQTVPLVFLDDEGNEVELEMGLTPRPGKMTTFGNLPSVKIWHQARTLQDKVGYFRFNMFLGVPDLMPAFNKAMAEFKDHQGMIVDLRGNPGGIGALAMGMSGWFIEERGKQLGVMSMRNGGIQVRGQSPAGRIHRTGGRAHRREVGLDL
jgi:carboxyl-terminal processing protease